MSNKNDNAVYLPQTCSTQCLRDGSLCITSGRKDSTFYKTSHLIPNNPSDSFHTFSRHIVANTVWAGVDDRKKSLCETQSLSPNFHYSDASSSKQFSWGGFSIRHHANPISLRFCTIPCGNLRLNSSVYKAHNVTV